MLPLGGKPYVWLCIIEKAKIENKQNISSLPAYVNINTTIFVILLKYLIVWWKKSLYFNCTEIFMKQVYLPNSLTSYFLVKWSSPGILVLWTSSWYCTFVLLWIWCWGQCPSSMKSLLYLTNFYGHLPRPLSLPWKSLNCFSSSDLLPSKYLSQSIIPMLIFFLLIGCYPHRNVNFLRKKSFLCFVKWCNVSIWHMVSA